MKSILSSYKAMFFYILVLLISGVLLVLQSHIKAADTYSLSLPQLAPALAVAVLCMITGDKKTRIQIYRAMPLEKKDIVWIPVILVLTGLAAAMTAGALSWLGIPYRKWDGTIWNILIIVCGCFFEEVGWRGFLLAHVERRHSPLISAVVVGFLWGFWHMSFSLGIAGFLVFIVTAIEMSLLMSWIYHNTNGKLLLMTLWHASINVWNQALLAERLDALGFMVFALVLGAFCAVVFLKNRKQYLGKCP